MKLKLSHSQMETLCAVVKRLAEYHYGDRYEDYLLTAMMQRLYEDLDGKFRHLQNTYKINWHPERALAFAAAAQVLTIPVTSHAGNVIMKITETVNKLIVNSN